MEHPSGGAFWGKAAVYRKRYTGHNWQYGGATTNGAPVHKALNSSYLPAGFCSYYITFPVNVRYLLSQKIAELGRTVEEGVGVLAAQVSWHSREIDFWGFGEKTDLGSSCTVDAHREAVDLKTVSTPRP